MRQPRARGVSSGRVLARPTKRTRCGGGAAGGGGKGRGARAAPGGGHGGRRTWTGLTRANGPRAHRSTGTWRARAALRRAQRSERAAHTCPATRLCACLSFVSLRRPFSLLLCFSASLLLCFSLARSLCSVACLVVDVFFFFRVQKKHGREHVAGSDPRRRGSGEHPAYTIGNVQRVCTQAFHDAGLATGLPTRSGEGRRSD